MMDAAELEQLFREELRPMTRLAYLLTLDHSQQLGQARGRVGRGLRFHGSWLLGSACRPR